MYGKYESCLLWLLKDLSASAEVTWFYWGGGGGNNPQELGGEDNYPRDSRGGG